MKKEQKLVTVSELNQKFSSKIYVPVEFQRQADAWTKKQQKYFIDSILENYYIPPLLFSNNQILDGLQRITCIHQFIDNKFSISLRSKGNEDSLKKCYFKDLASNQKEMIFNYNLTVFNLTNDDGNNLTPQEQKELFYRINTNSIKLNKAEIIFAMCPPQNRKIFIDVTSQNEDLKNLTNNKKGKRFSLEALLLWCLTVVYNRETGFMDTNSKASIRNQQKKFINLDFSDSNLKQFTENSRETIKLMNNILGNLIPPKNFKVIFSAVFVCIYENLDSHNSFIKNKQVIKEQLVSVFKKLVENQQIGGIHYDSYYYFKERIAEVMKVLGKYKIDANRFLSIKEKIHVYWENVIKNGGNVTCCECKKVIRKWEDINVDHIFAHTNGGKTEIKNSQILCKSCNLKKGKKDYLK